MLVWRRLVAAVKRRAEVPLADVGGGVAVRFEQLGQRDFALEQVHVVGAVVDHVVDAGPDVMPTGHENRAGRRTDTAAGMEIREPHTVGSQGVQRRGLDGSAVDPDVAVAEIVDEQYDHVGPVVGGGRCRRYEG